MVRSTRKSLAGQAAAAARKVVGRGSARAAQAEPSGSTATKSASPKKAAPKKAAPKKAAPTKAAPEKAAAKKAAPTKAAPEKAVPTKAAAAKKAATKAPATKKAAAKKTATKAPATKKAATKKTATEKTATKKTATKAPATKQAATKAAPAKKTTPRKTSPRKTSPGKTSPGKTSPARASAPADLAVKEDEKAWTKAELAEVLDELAEQRRHSVEFLAEQEAELSGLMRDSGDGAGQDQADLGASTFERDHELSVLTSERDKLAQIDRALARIEDGSYGRCESCGQAIGKMRLLAFPRATLCMTCKQREERR